MAAEGEGAVGLVLSAAEAAAVLDRARGPYVRGGAVVAVPAPCTCGAGVEVLTWGVRRGGHKTTCPRGVQLYRQSLRARAKARGGEEPVPSAAEVSAAARALAAAMPPERRARQSRANGAAGGRPRLASLPDCTCGVGGAVEDWRSHHSSCRRWQTMYGRERRAAAARKAAGV